MEALRHVYWPIVGLGSGFSIAMTLAGSHRTQMEILVWLRILAQKIHSSMTDLPQRILSRYRPQSKLAQQRRRLEPRAT
jgi:predicted Fe-S protein YdhL (DUF1289 family)